MQRPSVRSSAASSGSENREARIEKRAAAAASAAAKGKTREDGSLVVGSNLRNLQFTGGEKAMSCRCFLLHLQYRVDPHLDVHQDAQLGRRTLVVL